MATRAGGGSGTTYTYNITSALDNFGVGFRVTVVPGDGGGDGCPASSVTFEQVGFGTVSTPNTVSFSFTDTRSGDWWETVYIDADASGNLENGDGVWGTDPGLFLAICFDSDTFQTTQSFDWDSDVAASVGSVIYTGPAFGFLSETPKRNSWLDGGDFGGYDDL